MGPVSVSPPVTTPPDATSDAFRMFGWEFSCRDALAGNLRQTDKSGGKSQEEGNARRIA